MKVVRFLLVLVGLLMTLHGIHAGKDGSLGAGATEVDMDAPVKVTTESMLPMFSNLP